MTVPSYKTIVTFGKEIDTSVTSDAKFRKIANLLADTLSIWHPALKCRGLIEGKAGKNVAPRASRFSSTAIKNWETMLQIEKHFNQFEIFNADWKKEDFPDVYASINKMWNFGPEGYSERTHTGAENNIVLAVRKEIFGNNVEIFKNTLKLLAKNTAAIYGFIESDVEWDIPTSPGSQLRHRMINLRWHDVGINDYQRVLYRMDNMIPRLYWANVLSKEHFKDEKPNNLPLQFIAKREDLSKGLHYIEFICDPQADPKFHEDVAPYFNIVPPKS